ncbi:hypothetical protein [Streptomyces resistomycificus]|uniref:Uncharacterized protein n=1 Tax=Streptomyces resistomycificus TaxID=67356 RepID=A0A0L8LWS4_9ACTN|nr:hypothetical protein [Streptomyces resistomycificus]KOG42530.1 hypothetical protein ADK37_05305 [Streptomyces resistomycificus]KUN92682.1 hypothetical protein AQJ84_32410 [Streptomyces resistomycificus]
MRGGLRRSVPRTFRLPHHDGDTFRFETVGENGTGRSGVTFRDVEDGKATRVPVEAFDQEGLDTFTRG